MDADGRIDAAARRLAGAIPSRRRNQTTTTYGTVKSVAGSSMRVEVAGSELTVPCTSACSAATRGDRAVIVTAGNTATAVAVISTTS